VAIVADGGGEHIVASPNGEDESLGPAPIEICGQLCIGAASGFLASAVAPHRKGADVNPLFKRLAFALILVLVAVVAATAVGAAGRSHSAKTAAAGPWYTPPELRALNAYSDATFAGKKALLAGGNAARATSNRGAFRLAGPWYTPDELKALIAYSKASFAEKQAILAGRGG
jgi:hypothetical protein